MSMMKTLTVNGVTYKVINAVPTDSVTLLASAWKGDGNRYSQVVEVPGVTAHTKVDLQPTAEQLEEFHYKILAFVAENEGGVVTVYSIGDKPTGDHTIQITKTEVEGTGKIRGNTVGTTMPRPDWNQADPSKADYIQNKPDLPGVVFDHFPTEDEIKALPNKSFFTVKAYGSVDAENKVSTYYRSTNWARNALTYTAADGGKMYVVPVDQPVNEVYLPYYGIKTGADNATSNSTIINTLLSTAQYGATFRFPSGHFYFSEPINAEAKHISILGTANAGFRSYDISGTTFLHFPNLADEEAALTVQHCTVADFTICGGENQYNMVCVRDNAFTDISTVVQETIGVRAYGIKASGNMIIRNLGARNFFWGVWCKTANMSISNVAFNHCHYGLSIGHDIKVFDLFGFNVMVLLQMRGSVSSAIGVRGDSIGAHLVEIVDGGNNNTLVDLDADFCMGSIVSIGDGVKNTIVRNLCITGVHGRASVKQFYSTSNAERAANNITSDTVEDYGVISIKKGSSLEGAVIIANQEGGHSPLDSVGGYATPFVLLSAGENTLVDGVQFFSSSCATLTEDWTKKRIGSLSALGCFVRVQTSNGAMLYEKTDKGVRVISDAADIKSRMDLSAYAMIAQTVKAVNGITPDNTGNVTIELSEVEPAEAPSLTWLKEYGNTSTKYVLPDGYIYAYRQKYLAPGFYPLFTSQIPISKDPSLSGIYNGVGYKENVLLDGSGGEKENTRPCFLSGLIPAREGDIVYINKFENQLWEGTQVFYCIAEDGVTIISSLVKDLIDKILTVEGGSFIDDPAPDRVMTGARVLTDVKIPITKEMFGTNMDRVAYIRIRPYTYKVDPDEVLVTVGEPQIYDEVEEPGEFVWNWENTRVQYDKPDYLAMINALEARIAALENK